MARVYVATSTVGRPVQVFDRLRAQIEMRSLQLRMPIIKFERHARRQFYVFVAVDSVETLARVPQDVEEVFRAAGLRGPLFHVPPDQVAGFAGSDLQVHDLSRLQRARARAVAAVDSPLAPIGWYTEESAAEDTYDRLLLWMSSVGKGSWPSFVQACDALGLATAAHPPRSIGRKLGLLGHLEFDKGAKRWCVGPPAIVKSGEGTYLAGARSPSLATGGKVLESRQPGADGPARWEPMIPAVGLEAADVGRVGERLAAALPPLEGWLDSLKPADGLRLGAFSSVDVWVGDGFQEANETPEERGGGWHGSTGLYRLARDGAPTMIALFDGGGGRWRTGEWYGLQFAAFAASHQDLSWRYDANSSALIVPRQARPPFLYEKALVLSTGFLPVQQFERDRLVFRAPDPSVPELICERLGVTLESGSD